MKSPTASEIRTAFELLRNAIAAADPLRHVTNARTAFGAIAKPYAAFGPAAHNHPVRRKCALICAQLDEATKLESRDRMVRSLTEIANPRHEKAAIEALAIAETMPAGTS